uniref:Uncharacterized protein n=1 Tax=Arundo donax TaxID=35708 RepID=A0A0A8Z0L6_ARUDO
MAMIILVKLQAISVYHYPLHEVINPHPVPPKLATF